MEHPERPKKSRRRRDDRDAADDPFLQNLSDAVEMSEQAELFSPEMELRQQRRNLRSASRTACPGCGCQVSAAAVSCRSCGLTFRAGRCAGCGAAISLASGKPRSESEQCRCRAMPVIYGDFQHPPLCTHCGRSVPLMAGWFTRRAFRRPDPHPELACPYCVADRILQRAARQEADSDQFQKPAARKVDSVGGHHPSEVIETLDTLISALQNERRSARKEALRSSQSKMLGQMFSAVFWGALTGSPVAGVGIASLSGNSADEPEQRLSELQQELDRITVARKRLKAAFAAERGLP